jgi:hypothetical protein
MSRRWKAVLIAAAAVAGLQLLYLVAVNVALKIAPRRYMTGHHEQLYLEWDHAWSPWYGRFYVRGFHLRFQDPDDVQLDLAVDRANADLSLASLIRRRITFRRIRAEGAAFRMVTKVSPEAAKRLPKRVAAFPRIQQPGFSPVKEGGGPRQLTQADVDKLWRIELRDTVGALREIWFDEYRYQGPARVRGELVFEPHQSITVAPTSLRLDGGTLSAGGDVLASVVSAAIDASIPPTSDLRERPRRVIRALSAHARVEANVMSLTAVELYRHELQFDGAGLLTADVVVNEGRISRDSWLSLGLDRLTAGARGFALSGRGRLDARAAARGVGLDLTAGVDGTLTSPPVGGERLVMQVRDTSATMAVSSRDLLGPPRFLRLNGRVGEVSTVNTRVLAQQAAKKVPLLANTMLGAGPLTASGDVTVTRKHAVVRLEQAKLGSAVMQGVAQRSKGRWTGAAAGIIGGLTVGVQVQDSRAHYEPFVGQDWLHDALEQLGLEPIAPRPAPLKPGS